MVGYKTCKHEFPADVGVLIAKTLVESVNLWKRKMRSSYPKTA
jgi:hypothetical protein